MGSQRIKGRQYGGGRSVRHVFQYTVLLASITLALGAWAQERPAATEEGAEKNDGRGKIQEVVVTAERHRTSAQKTAASVTAVSAEELQRKGVTSVEGVLRDVAAVEVQASPQGGQVYVRGVGANGDSNWVDPSVSLMFDNVYSGRAERVFASVYDIDRIEILRGPQGTLYGRNATGGTVNVLSANPTDQLEGNLHLQIGNFGLKHVDGALNIPLNDALAVRIALLREKRDGYFSNGSVASDLKGARVKALLKPARDFFVLATFDTIRNTGNGATSVPFSYTGEVPPFVNWPTYPINFSSPWQVDDLHPAEQRNAKFTTWSLEANYDMGWGVATFVPAFTRSTRWVNTNLITGIATPPGLASSTWSEDQRSAELRIASPARSTLRWVAGLYHFKTENTQTGAPPAGFGVSTWETYGVQTPTDSNAAFGQLTYPLTDTLRLTGGVRYTRDAKRQFYGVRSLVGAYDSGIMVAENKYSALTYKAGIEIDLARTSMLYAQVASGYKAGGFSTTTTPPVPYEPEKLTAFELGSKNSFLDGRLQVNAELYLYRYNNYQVQYPDFAAPSPNPDDAPGATYFAQFVVNADTGKNKGGEVEAKYRLTPDDEFRIGLSYTHARYGHFSQPALAYLSGTAVTNTPRSAATIGYKHEFVMADGAVLTAGASTKLSEGYRVVLSRGMPGGDQHVYQRGYHRSDLHLSYLSPKEEWTVSAWARNLENKAQVANALPFGRVQITDPRTFGIDLSYKF